MNKLKEYYIQSKKYQLKSIFIRKYFMKNIINNNIFNYIIIMKLNENIIIKKFM